jgi:hypothetical protein
MPYLRLVKRVLLEEGRTELEITEGMKFRRFYFTLHEYRKMEVSYDNPYSSNG